MPSSLVAHKTPAKRSTHTRSNTHQITSIDSLLEMMQPVDRPNTTGQKSHVSFSDTIKADTFNIDSPVSRSKRFKFSFSSVETTMRRCVSADQPLSRNQAQKRPKPILKARLRDSGFVHSEVDLSMVKLGANEVQDEVQDDQEMADILQSMMRKFKRVSMASGRVYPSTEIDCHFN